MTRFFRLTNRSNLPTANDSITVSKPKNQFDLRSAHHYADVRNNHAEPEPQAIFMRCKMLPS
jgi:hypothetical protein